VIVVVLPAYNEAENLGPLLDRIRAALDDVEHRVVVVDDGSTDETAQLADYREDPRVAVCTHAVNQGLSEKLRLEQKRSGALAASFLG